MNTKTINTMNKFNLNDLRSDASQYLTDQIRTEHRKTTMALSWCSIPDLIDSIWLDHHVNHMICALIGSDYYAVMNRNPLTTIRFDFRGSHQVLNAHDPSDPFLHSLNVLIAAYLA